MTTYTYTNFSGPPGTFGGVPQGINDTDQIVGSYNDPNGGTFGFVYSNGVYTTINDPLATSNYTSAIGINNLGQIVGTYSVSTNIGAIPNGFLYSNGVYTTIDDPLATGGTIAASINDLGQIVGSYSDSNGAHGFLYSNGVYTTLDDPLATGHFTVPTGINDAGQIVGHYIAASSNGANGFLYSNGVFTTIDDPLGTYSTSADGINDVGQIVGHYEVGFGGPVYMFIYSGGVYTTIDDPVATLPTPAAINDLGQIVGYDSVQTFLASPMPPPAPTVEADSAHVSVAGTITANAAHGVLANDVDPIPNDTLIVSAVGGQSSNVGRALAGAYGTLTLNADGSFSYVADPSVPSNIIAQDIFTYTATDGAGGSATSSLTITITLAGQTYIAGTPGQALTSGNGSVLLDGSLLQNQTITAGNGNDAVIAGSNDIVVLGNGNDVVKAADSDKITLRNGSDTVTAGTNSSIRAGSGNDNVTAGADSKIKLGNGAGDSVSANSSSHDKITLGDGAGDSVSAYGSYDTITLGNGDGDTVTANGSSHETITLGYGAHDSVSANSSNHDKISLGDGADDSVSAYGSNDTITLGNGAGDTVTANGSSHETITDVSGSTTSVTTSATVAEVVTLSTLVTFNGANGAEPVDGLIADAKGDLFGTTDGGGAYGGGTVFEIAKTATGYASAPSTLVSFNGAHDNSPSGSLIADGDGDLFGTTFADGANGVGTVFEIAKTATGYASTPTTLVNFDGADGANPLNLIADRHGDLFGTTVGGGGGTVFEVVKTATGYASSPNTLVSFDGANGSLPYGRLIADQHGDLFGQQKAAGRTAPALCSRSPRPPPATSAARLPWSTSTAQMVPTPWAA
jgi:probable HAF family extracellular repeat protein/uncharacterized repeat protein (TIGR03803 family)/VCBS repeat-containing protein